MKEAFVLGLRGKHCAWHRGVYSVGYLKTQERGACKVKKAPADVYSQYWGW